MTKPVGPILMPERCYCLISQLPGGTIRRSVYRVQMKKDPQAL